MDLNITSNSSQRKYSHYTYNYCSEHHLKEQLLQHRSHSSNEFSTQLYSGICHYELFIQHHSWRHMPLWTLHPPQQLAAYAIMNSSPNTTAGGICHYELFTQHNSWRHMPLWTLHPTQQLAAYAIMNSSPNATASCMWHYELFTQRNSKLYVPLWTMPPLITTTVLFEFT